MLAFGYAELPLLAPIICGKLEALFTMEARTMVTDFFDDEHTRSLDLMGGLKGHIGNVALLGAAGAGALKGYGSPAARVTICQGPRRSTTARNPPRRSATWRQCLWKRHSCSRIFIATSTAQS